MSSNFDMNSASFEDCSHNVELTIKKTSQKYLEIFNLNSENEIPQFFSSKESSNNTVCLKIIFGQGAWRCYDCIKTRNIFFCKDCWTHMADKHKDHNVVYLTEEYGFCQCGDHNCLNKEYFCANHKGYLLTDPEIKKYINNNLGEDLYQKIKAATENLFGVMHKYYIKAINNKKTKDDDFIKNVGEFFDCFGILCKVSKACNHIIAELLLGKYPCKMKHECLDINENGGRIIKSSIFNHECACQFLRFILEFLPKENLILLLKFADNYKLRKTIGLYYFFFYSDYIKNCISSFEYYSNIIIFKDSLKIASNIPGLIDKMFDGLKEIFKVILVDYTFVDIPLYWTLNDNTKSQKYNYLNNILSNLNQQMLYLLKQESYSYLADNSNILFKIIDLMILFHNIKPARLVTPAPLVDLEPSYFPELIQAEQKILELFSFIISIFNFNNVNLVKEVFTYFSKTILKKIKNKLEENEYSFHIPIFRAFSIFLNRFCFNEANKTNSNIFAIMLNISKSMPDFQKCCQKIITGIYKVFAFVAFCGDNYFDYHGVNMKKYEQYYYVNPHFIYRDFCLLKYLLSLTDNAKYFKFTEIINLPHLDNLYNPILKYFSFGGDFSTSDSYSLDTKEKYLKFSSRMMRIMLSLLRNNTCFLWNLSSGYVIMKFNKLRDSLIEDLFSKDINYFTDLTKELIINQVLIKDNFVSFSTVSDGIFLSLSNFFGDKIIKDLIISLTKKTLNEDNEVKLSLNEDALKCVDLNYIINPAFKSKIEEYIKNSKSKTISIYNTLFYPMNKFESELLTFNYNNFLISSDNILIVVQFINFILKNEGLEILEKYFLSILLDYLTPFFHLGSEYSGLFKKIPLTDNIMKLLENNNLKDEKLKSHCQFIAQKFKSMNNNILEKDSNIIEGNKIEINSEEKHKVEINNNEIIVDKSDEDNKNEIKEDYKDKKICIYCQKNVEENDIVNIPGVLGYFLFDHYHFNAFYQTIKEQYNKQKEINPQLKEFDEMYQRKKEVRSVRILTCNHYVHFECFSKNVEMNPLSSNPLLKFSCSYCHKPGETFIPLLTNYTEEQTQGSLKGFSLDYISKIGEKHNEKNEEQKEEDNNKEDNDNLVTFRTTNPLFVNLCKGFVEGFFCKVQNVESLDLEYGNNKEVFSIFHSQLSSDYQNLFCCLDNLEEKKYTLDLWKNFILSVRLLIKLDILAKEKYILALYNLIKEFVNLSFKASLETSEIENNHLYHIYEIIFLITCFFDYEEIEGYEKYILYMALPIFAFGFYLKNLYIQNSFIFSKEKFLEHLNIEELYKFLKEDDSLNLIIIHLVKELLINKIIISKGIDIDKLSLELNDNLDLLNLSSLKNKTLLETLDELGKLIEVDSTNEKMKHIYENFKTKNNYEEVLKKVLNDYIEKTKNGECCEQLGPHLFIACIPNIYKFIDLPETLMDLNYNIYDKKCEVCKKEGKNQLLCLYCGAKVCNSASCVVDNEGEKIQSIFFHSTLCGGCRNAYLQANEGNVLFHYMNEKYKRCIPLYVNEFGEDIKKDSFGKEYKLNHSAVKKALKMFNEFSYRGDEKKA